jgi:sterol 3beta-glucosyltransferase
LEDISASDEELENDFEETPRIPNDVALHAQQDIDAMGPSGKESPLNVLRDRAGSMATVRLHRRARLAEKLKEVYDLDDIREVWAGVSILYFSANHILYYIKQKCPAGYYALSVSTNHA